MVLLVTLFNGIFASSSGGQRESNQDPNKQSLAELKRAESAFDGARAAYDKGEIEKGDAALEDMTKALDACLETLQSARKARLYKRAELKVANLQRRLAGLLEDISVEQRGWAEQTNRKLEEIHDKLLAGAMRK
jgi:hypothetical protein